VARSRILKPGFFSNEQLSELPFEDRLCFAGLWTLADREGRLEDRPKRIKAALFPWDDVDMPAMLTALAALGFIDRYTVDGVDIIQVVSFTKHQNPHTREQSSELPAKTQSREKAVPSPEKAVPCHGKAGSSPAVSTSTSTSVSTSTSNSVARGPKQAGRIFLHRWQLDALINTLGPHAEDFGLDEWLDELSRSAGVLPTDRWAWVQGHLEAEVKRRGLSVSEAPAAPTNKRIAGLMAGGEAFLKRAAEQKARQS